MAMRAGCVIGMLALQTALWTLGMPVFALASSGKAEPGAAPPGAADAQQEAGFSAPVQGPAVGAPREILEMLDQRKRALDKKEAALRTAEARLGSLKGEIEAIVARHEQALKRAEQARKHDEEQRAAAAQNQAKADADTLKADRARIAKMYETMPPEEAAARIERMPSDRALELLRLLKGKTAGAILAQVPPAKAAKLTERLIPTQH